MKAPKHQWPDTPIARGVLFFAQLLQEMLEESTFESFRVYSLDTPTRIAEAIHVLRDVTRDRIPGDTFNPVREELIWSLKKDVIAKALLGEHVAIFEKEAPRKETPLTSIKDHLAILSKRVKKGYQQSCGERILSLLGDENSRIELRQVTGFFCSHLINVGYSKSYLLRFVNEFFFSRPFKRVGTSTVRSFLSKLDGKAKKYVVYAVVDKPFYDFLTKVEWPVHRSVAALPANLQLGISQSLPLPIDHAYALVDAERMDENSAQLIAMEMLTSARALGMLVAHQPERKWLSEMYVVKERASTGVLIKGKNLPLNRNNVSIGASRRAFSSPSDYSKRILSNFDNASTSRLLTCIRTSGLARTSSSTETQLTSLWSAFEVLLSEPASGVPRIVHYINLLAPLVCTRYARRQFIAVYEALIVAYKAKFKKILKSETAAVGLDEYTRFVSLICLPENQAARDALLQLTAANPLALHRLFKLNRDYSTPRGLLAALDGHEKRVSWQLHRIYRARNNLVHSGRRPSFNSLVVNLDDFFRVSLGTLVNWAAKEAERSQIDQCVSEIGIEYKIQREILVREQSRAAFTLEIARRIIK